MKKAILTGALGLMAFSSMLAQPTLVEKVEAKEGKIVAVCENGFITIKKGEWKIRVEKATHVPLTLGGKAKFMIANALAATLASYLWGFKTEDISLSLQTFIPSAAQTPGRMNIFEFKKFKVLIDFAHNPATVS